MHIRLWRKIVILLVKVCAFSALHSQILNMLRMVIGCVLIGRQRLLLAPASHSEVVRVYLQTLKHRLQLLHLERGRGRSVFRSHHLWAYKLLDRATIFLLALTKSALVQCRRTFEVYLARTAILELWESRNLLLLVLQKQMLLHHFRLAMSLLSMVDPLR